MANFENIQDALENQQEKDTVNVELITLSGVKTIEVEEGMTIKEFKEMNGLIDVKIVNDDGDVLTNNDIIDEDTQLFISTPKKNG